MKKATAKILYEQIKYYEKFLYLYEKFGYNVYYYYLKFREFITGRRIPMNFVYITNTQCTLRCKECHTYIPYFNAQSHFMVDFITCNRRIHDSNYGITNQPDEYKDYAKILRNRLKNKVNQA